MVLFWRTEFRMLERELRCSKFGLRQNLTFAIDLKLPCHPDKASVLAWTLLLSNTAAFVLTGQTEAGLFIALPAHRAGLILRCVGEVHQGRIFHTHVFSSVIS